MSLDNGHRRERAMSSTLGGGRCVDGGSADPGGG